MKGGYYFDKKDVEGNFITNDNKAYTINSLKVPIDITKKFDLFISGINYFITEDGNYYVIKINDLHQYAGFEKAT